MADRIAVMDRGVLQQYGSPKDLYKRPANTFVARFIGSVLNNFIPARYADGALHVGDGSIALGDRRAAFERSDPAAGLTATIRPERVMVVDPSSHQATLRGHVVLVEPLGPKDVVHLEHRRNALARARAAQRATDPREPRRPLLRPRSGARVRRRQRSGGALMARIRLEGVEQALRRRDGHEGRDARHRGRGVLRGPRAAGRRQDDDCCARSSASRRSTPAAYSSTTSDITEMWPGDRNIAIVFQNLALYPDKTVYNNLAFPLKQHKVPKAEIAERVATGGQGAQDRGPARPQAGQALGRRAAARRNRAGDRPRPARLSVRRAALRARRAPAARDAQRAQVPAARSQPHARVRDARSGRGDEHGRPHRRVARRSRAASGGTRGGLPPCRPTASWRPPSAARR